MTTRTTAIPDGETPLAQRKRWRAARDAAISEAEGQAPRLTKTAASQDELIQQLRAKLVEAEAARRLTHSAIAKLGMTRDRVVALNEEKLAETADPQIADTIAYVDSEMARQGKRSAGVQREKRWDGLTIIVATDSASMTRRMARLRAIRRELEALAIEPLDAIEICARIRGLLETVPQLKYEPVPSEAA